MMLEEAISLYEALEEDKKAQFLTSLSYEITVWLRDTYDERLPADLRMSRLMGGNELQHHLSSQARHHIEQDTERYPDDVFIRILADKAQHYGLSGHFADALSRCLEKAT